MPGYLEIEFILAVDAKLHIGNMPRRARGLAQQRAIVWCLSIYRQTAVDCVAQIASLFLCKRADGQLCIGTLRAGAPHQRGQMSIYLGSPHCVPCAMQTEHHTLRTIPVILINDMAAQVLEYVPSAQNGIGLWDQFVRRARPKIYEEQLDIVRYEMRLEEFAYLRAASQCSRTPWTEGWAPAR